MEEPVFASEDLSVRTKQVQLIREGRSIVHEGEEQTSLNDDALALLLDGKWDDLSMKQQYWARKYYEAGFKAKARVTGDIRKTMSKPASLGEVSMFLQEMIYGQNGLHGMLEDRVSSVNVYLMVLAEALKLKGLLNEDDLVAARESLLKQAADAKEKLSEAAKAEAEAITMGASPATEPAPPVSE